MVTTESLPEYLTVAEVASRLRLHPVTIRRQCKAGKIAGANRVSRHWRIPARYLSPDSANTNTPSPQIGG